MSDVVVVSTISDMRGLVKERMPAVVGFVPTMGALHAGHVSLIENARRDCDLVIVSIFVNPLQFGPEEDLGSYPRQPAADVEIAMGAGADKVFAPSRDELIGDEPLTSVNIAELDERLCGRSRPGHFAGVASILAKFFNIIAPDRAYFGEKDWQQFQIVRRMAHDLNYDIEIIPVSTVRDEDGLAISSRNRYLSAGERRAAVVLPRALEAARVKVEDGETRAGAIVELVKEMIATEPAVRLEYFSVCRPENLTDVDRITGDVLLAAAVNVGAARLIDNVVIRA